VKFESLPDFNNPPNLISAVADQELYPADCGINTWIRQVPQGALLGLTNGHRPGTQVPSWMTEGGPLREAMMREFAFRAYSEEFATRGLCYLAAIAPTTEEMEYFVTQVVDEARHSACFREHLVELGVPAADLAQTQAKLVQKERDQILVPLDAWGRPFVEEQKDYLAGVALITILLEGVLAPSAALSEIKWRLLDPVAAEIEQCANLDEIRHLAVCANIIREHLLRGPRQKSHLIDFIAEGFERWQSVPIAEVVFQRETLYQAGLAEHRGRVGALEIVPGVRLADSTPEQRLGIAMQWSREMQANRLLHMGLSELVQR
jgi:hypothetical protein